MALDAHGAPYMLRIAPHTLSVAPGFALHFRSRAVHLSPTCFWTHALLTDTTSAPE